MTCGGQQKYVSHTEKEGDDGELSTNMHMRYVPVQMARAINSAAAAAAAVAVERREMIPARSRRAHSVHGFLAQPFPCCGSCAAQRPSLSFSQQTETIARNPNRVGKVKPPKTKHIPYSTPRNPPFILFIL